MLKDIVEVKEVVPSHPWAAFYLPGFGSTNSVRLRGSKTDIRVVQLRAGPDTRESEVALAYVRSSSALARAYPFLRKMAALIHRDDAPGVIAQRIIGSDADTVRMISRIIDSMWLDPTIKPSLAAGFDLFGWPVIREIAVAVMLHQVHEELAAESEINPHDLDRLALAVSTGGVEVGVDVFAAMLSNVGIAGLVAIGGEKYANLRRSAMNPAELPAMERNTFGFSHAALGAGMLCEADLPERICRGVLEHSTPSSPIWICEEIAGQAGLHLESSATANPLPGDALERLNLSERRVLRIKEAMAAAADLPGIHFAKAA